MFKNSTYLNMFRERLHRELPDSLDRVIYTLFIGSIILSTIKLFIALPLYLGNAFVLPVVGLAITLSFGLSYVLYVAPYKLLLLTKIGLIWMATYILLILAFSPDHMNLISIQHMLIVIMMAFYGVNRYWGLVFSAFFSILVLLYMFGIRDGRFNMTMFPESFDFNSAFAIVLINFIQIAFIHYLYNRTLTKTVRDIRDLNVELKKLAYTKSDFLSTMSHELRTPLNSLLGTAYLLADDENENRSDNLKNLRFSAENLLVMINNILDYSKMDAKNTHLESIPFPIANTLESVINGLTYKTTEKKSLELTLSVSDELRSTKVLGDPTRLTQIIFNLVGNAIKFTPAGFVTISVTQIRKSAEDIDVSFEIADSGIGIYSTMLEEIFTPFTQGSADINREYGGTGLGLAIVKHLVDLHGGHIRVDSVVGQGTVFYLTLPYKVVTEETVGPKRRKSPDTLIDRRNYKDLRVLLAEDNQMSVIFMKQLLSRWNITPVIAGDGEEVIRLIEGGAHFDVILMDIRMPRVTGLEAADFIREWEKKHGNRAHIIALTASVSSRFGGQLEELGFDDYLSKPFWPDDLLHKIELAIAKKY